VPKVQDDSIARAFDKRATPTARVLRGTPVIELSDGPPSVIHLLRGELTDGVLLLFLSGESLLIASCSGGK
jgi:hypothetical protein